MWLAHISNLKPGDDGPCTFYGLSQRNNMMVYCFNYVYASIVVEVYVLMCDGSRAPDTPTALTSALVLTTLVSLRETVQIRVPVREQPQRHFRQGRGQSFERLPRGCAALLQPGAPHILCCIAHVCTLPRWLAACAYTICS